MLVGLGQGGMFVVDQDFMHFTCSLSRCVSEIISNRKTLLNESAFGIFVAAGQQPLDGWQMPGSVRCPPPCVFGIRSLGRARVGLRTCFWGLMDGLHAGEKKNDLLQQDLLHNMHKNIRKPKMWEF